VYTSKRGTYAPLAHVTTFTSPSACHEYHGAHVCDLYTAASRRRAFLVEVMDRDSGYLALMAGMAGDAEVVVIPEVDVLGAAAVDHIATGATGVLVGLMGADIAATRLDEVVATPRRLNPALVDLARVLAQ
jgi:6-phosphofructokinase